MIQVRVFTHPICSGCVTPIQLAQRMKDENSDVELEIISLGSAPGRERARAEGILSVPTLFVGSKRIDGVPEWDQLMEAVAACRAAGWKSQGTTSD